MTSTICCVKEATKEMESAKTYMTSKVCHYVNKISHDARLHVEVRHDCKKYVTPKWTL